MAGKQYAELFSGRVFFPGIEQPAVKWRPAPVSPYLLGRGAPYMDYIPNAQWLGLSADHKREDLAAAAVFGVLSALRQSCDLLAELPDHKADTIMLQSLAKREESVRNAACDLFVQPCKKIPVNPEASLLGAAIIGTIATKIHADFSTAYQKMIQVQELSPSSPDRKENAREYYRRYSAASQL